MTIYMPPVESQFSKLHEMVSQARTPESPWVFILCALSQQIIARDKTLEPAPRAKGIALGMILMQGDLPTVRKQ